MRTVLRPDRVIGWLLDGDPAVRWQTLRDLVGARGRAVERERRKVARQGWGARLLAKQGPDGRWARGRSSDAGLYSPKWISTTYTLLTLRDFGLPAGHPGARKACRILLEEGLQRDGGVSYGTWASWTRQGETCISGMVLSLLSYFGLEDDRLDTIGRHLLEEQMPRGGTTTSSARSTTSRPSARLVTRASPTRSRWSGATGKKTAGGRSRTATRARSTSSWSASARRAAGTRFGRCGS